MLRLDNISYSVEGRPLIEGASAVIPSGHKVGVVGRNGTGKTTLFRLIRGELVLETGRIELPRGARIGGVAQEVPGNEVSLIDTVLAADTELASRLAGLGLGAAIVQTNYWLSTGESPNHAAVMGALAAWAGLSFVLQQLQSRTSLEGVVSYAWAAVDAVLYTSLLYLAEGPQDALAAGYPLLVAASGLWFRVRLVVWMTGVCLCAWLWVSGSGRIDTNMPPHYVVDRFRCVAGRRGGGGVSGVPNSDSESLFRAAGRAHIGVLRRARMRRKTLSVLTAKDCSLDGNVCRLERPWGCCRG